MSTKQYLDLGIAGMAPSHSQVYSNRMMQHAELSAPPADHHSLGAVVSGQIACVRAASQAFSSPTRSLLLHVLAQNSAASASDKKSSHMRGGMTVTRVPTEVVRNATSSCLLTALLLVSRLQSGTS